MAVRSRGGRFHQLRQPRRRASFSDLRDAAGPAATPVRGHGGGVFTATNLLKMITYFALGQFSRQILLAAATLLAILATLAGVWLVRRAPADRFYNLVYGHLGRPERIAELTCR
jgi:hypothetical protein